MKLPKSLFAIVAFASIAHAQLVSVRITVSEFYPGGFRRFGANGVIRDLIVGTVQSEGPLHGEEVAVIVPSNSEVSRGDRSTAVVVLIHEAQLRAESKSPDQTLLLLPEKIESENKK